MKSIKISKGIYEYKGYRISNCGYHHSDHCVWWEAVNNSTGCVDFHANTKKEIVKMIDAECTNKKPLVGRAEFRVSRNDMFWDCYIFDWHNEAESFHIKWTGYNDAYWWDDVSEKASITVCKGDKGTEKKFKLSYSTLEVVEVK